MSAFRLSRFRQGPVVWVAVCILALAAANAGADKERETDPWQTLSSNHSAYNDLNRLRQLGLGSDFEPPAVSKPAYTRMQFAEATLLIVNDMHAFSASSRASVEQFDLLLVPRPRGETPVSRLIAEFRPELRLLAAKPRELQEAVTWAQRFFLQRAVLQRAGFLEALRDLQRSSPDWHPYDEAGRIGRRLARSEWDAGEEALYVLRPPQHGEDDLVLGVPYRVYKSERSRRFRRAVVIAHNAELARLSLE